MAKKAIGTVTGKGFVNGIYTDYATTSTTADTAKNYFEGGALEQKLTDFETRLLDLGYIHSAITFMGKEIGANGEEPNVHIGAYRQGNYVIVRLSSSITKLDAGVYLDNDTVVFTLPEKFRPKEKISASISYFKVSTGIEHGCKCAEISIDTNGEAKVVNSYEYYSDYVSDETILSGDNVIGFEAEPITE